MKHAADKKNWNLYIDTTEFGKVIFGLAKGPPEPRIAVRGKLDSGSGFRIKSGMTRKESYKITPQESERILAQLDAFLKKSKIKNPCLVGGRAKSEIKRIIVYKGKGNFTGLRIAAAIANALSLAWRVKMKVILK